MKKFFNITAAVIIPAFITAALLTQSDSIADLLQLEHTEPVDPKQVAPDHHRFLTAREKQGVSDILGSDLDLADVQIYFYDRGVKGTISSLHYSPDPILAVYGREHRSDDFSLDADPESFGILYYGAMQIWERDNAAAPSGDVEYPKTLSTKYTLAEYTLTSQAKIIEDYARRFIHPEHETLYLQNKTGWDNCKNDLILARTVEKAFTAASHSRTQLEKQYRRPLSQGEKQLIRGIFDSQINTETVNAHLSPRDCAEKVGSVNSANDMHFWGADNHADDYSQVEDVKDFGTFIHEITHIWQRHRQFADTIKGVINKDDKYAYTLDIAKKSFKDYEKEQQAAIIEDYARYYLHKGQDTWKLQRTEYNLEQLKAVVEDHFPQAARTRQHFERNKALPIAQTRQDIAMPSI
tara:strand:+ start:14754 stop:15977 length:1224 start_codon:yes stop_codon:yes gene_type:complete